MIVKICGVRTIPDALAALDAGADMIGLNFHPPSPRCVSTQQAAALAAVIHDAAPHCVVVGVFVNMAAPEVRAILDECRLDLAQLAGDEGAETLAALDGRAFKAIRTGEEAARLARPGSPALLLDAGGRGQYGGTGQLADWRLAAMLATQHNILLAGGLTPANVAEAVAAVQPWGVDVASGVESAPGVKDADKMRAFIRAVRGPDAAGKGKR